MTREALVLGFVVETGLLVSDCYYVFKTEPNLFPTLSFRLAFMIGSVFNIFCVVVMFWKLHLTTDIQKLLKKEWKKRRVQIHFPSPSSFFSQYPAITEEPHNQKQQQPEEPPATPAMEIV
jgi:hypothetical protein